MEPKAIKEIMDFNTSQNEEKVSSFKFSSIPGQPRLVLSSPETGEEIEGVLPHNRSGQILRGFHIFHENSPQWRYREISVHRQNSR